MRRLAVLALVAAGLAGCGGGTKQAVPARPLSGFDGTELGVAPSADFALRDQDGRLVRLSAFRGKLVFVTFLYTHCPDVCPLIATRLNTVLHKLGPERAGVRVLAVSVDPKRDTPDAARRFVRSRALLPQFHFLIGTRRELAGVWRAYRIAVLPGPKGTVSHSAYTLLLDRQGRRRLLYDARTRPAAMLHDLRLLGQR